MKIKALTIAGVLMREGHSRKEAMLQAWNAVKVEAQMKQTDERGMWITFKKEDGTTRNALATLNPQVVPAPKATSEPKPNRRPIAAICFFDLFEGGIRSFRADRLITKAVA